MSRKLSDDFQCHWILFCSEGVLPGRLSQHEFQEDLIRQMWALVQPSPPESTF